jgi:erythromycin esterase-like protein
MREYNLNNPSRQISFYGFHDGNPWAVMNNVEDYLSTVDPLAEELARRNYACLPPFDEITSKLFSSEPLAVRKDCFEKASVVYEQLATKKDTYAPQTSPELYEQALQDARVVLAGVEYIAGLSNYEGDAAWAQNVNWIMNAQGSDSKIAVWAHNRHIQRSITYATLGSLLVDEYGNDVRIIGTTFYSGAFTAVSSTFSLESSPEIERFVETKVAIPSRNSYEYYFHLAGLPAFILDLRQNSPNAPLPGWLLEPKTLRSVGAIAVQGIEDRQSHLANLPQEYDAIIYLRDTSPTNLLPPID